MGRSCRYEEREWKGSPWTRRRVCIIHVHAHQSWVGQLVRFHILLDESEKEEFRRLAEREGKSLGEWIREAARERAAAAAAHERVDSVDALRAFFRACDERAGEVGQEPDWEVHKETIEASKRGGMSAT